MDVSEYIGNTYGRLTAISETKLPNGRTGLLCKCQCGNEKICTPSDLRRGHITSCGCFHKEMMQNKQFKHGDAGNHHGYGGSRLYHIWRGMKRRCFNKKDWAYKNYYGVRGITMCDEWLDYAAFKEWALNNGYDDSLTIERKNNDGNYEPSNCEWIPFSMQGRNRRNNHFISFRGETHTIAEWEQKLNFRRGTIRNRISYGWDIEKILTTPVKKIKRRSKCVD